MHKPTALTETAPSVFPGLYVVTVNLNLKQDTYECLQSLLNAGASIEQLIVVDNGSQDDSVAFLRHQFGERLSILTSLENLGYADGLNRGIEHSLKGSNSEWLLLINNDTLVDKNFLKDLLQVAQQKKFELLGPVIFYKDIPEKIWACGDRIIPGTMIGYSLYKEGSLPENIHNPVPVSILNGCCLLVHRTVFDQVGLFDTSFFMYAEEVDFCWRARQAGFQMACVTKAKMWHKVSASANRVRDYSLYLRIRNQILFYRRYANFAQLPIMFIFSFIRNLLQGTRYFAGGLPQLSLAVVRGWKDGWFTWK